MNKLDAKSALHCTKIYNIHRYKLFDSKNVFICCKYQPKIPQIIHIKRTKPLLDATTAAGYLLKFMSTTFYRSTINACSF